MDNSKEALTCDCNFSGIKPAVMDLPYPPIRVRERNPGYADLIGISYCGMISEMSAVMQYINNESRMAGSRCAEGKILLGMAIAEMTHMQMLAGLINLLGGNVGYTSRQAGAQPWMWTPQCLTLYSRVYNMHIRMIGDDYVNSVLNRIVQDEQYHVMLLRSMMDVV